MYNLGRGFQQIGTPTHTLTLSLTHSLTHTHTHSLLGVVHVACHFYRQALALEPENNDPKVSYHSNKLNSY